MFYRIRTLVLDDANPYSSFALHMHPSIEEVDSASVAYLQAVMKAEG